MSNTWSREESILALALYCKIPFSKISKTNKDIIELANHLNRTPSAVAMKMCNFGRFDPELQARGISGLSNGSHLDRIVWDEYFQNMEQLFYESERILGSPELLLDDNSTNLPFGNDVSVLSTTRRGQAFFRRTVLSAYNNTCCVTGLNIPSLLQASHIKPWADSDPRNERTNPKNGFCFNSLHHNAFDIGLISIDTNYQLIVSKSAKDAYSNQIFKDFFVKYEGKRIALPKRFLPSKEYINYRNSKLEDF